MYLIKEEMTCLHVKIQENTELSLRYDTIPKSKVLTLWCSGLAPEILRVPGSWSGNSNTQWSKVCSLRNTEKHWMMGAIKSNFHSPSGLCEVTRDYKDKAALMMPDEQSYILLLWKVSSLLSPSFSLVTYYAKKKKSPQPREIGNVAYLVIPGATELTNYLKSKGLQNNPKDDQTLSLITN